jgi:hypothetical protein
MELHLSTAFFSIVFFTWHTLVVDPKIYLSDPDHRIHNPDLYI